MDSTHNRRTAWLLDVLDIADSRGFHIDEHDRRLGECFDAGIDPEDTVNEFIQDAHEGHCLYQRAPW